MPRIVSVAAILLLLGTGCVSSPVPQPAPPPSTPEEETNPHASWQTYENSVYAFSLEYPGTVADPSVEQVSLPDAIGEKSRSFHVFFPKPEELTERGCFSAGVNGSIAEEDFSTKEGVMFCLTTATEGAAGSTYLTYHYVTMLPAGPVDLAFTIRYATDVHVYGGCETDADLASPFCVEHAFDEARDTALFEEIFATFHRTLEPA